jgi:hypothetical protein
VTAMLSEFVTYYTHHRTSVSMSVSGASHKWSSTHRAYGSVVVCVVGDCMMSRSGSRDRSQSRSC